MAEYIDREALRKAIQVDGYEHFSGCISSSEITLLEMVDECICQAPAADVAPVRHGRWVNKKEWHLGRWVGWFECSCCGERDYDCEMYEMLPFGGEPLNYCPNCGAKMDEERKENENV